MISIRKKFAQKLIIVILLMAVPIFVISLGVLFSQSRHILHHQAVGRANSMLHTTLQRVERNMNTVETATNAYYWQVAQNLHPDSLFAISNWLVWLNGNIDGCSISMEPGVFPKYGRYFSVYTVRVSVGARTGQRQERDSISTVIEKQYEYFDKVWYKTPRDLKQGCWTAYYDEVDTLDLTLDGMVASYGKPLYDNDGRFIGVISTDLSLKRMSKVVSSGEKPYPNSYFMMVDENGRFFIHPDSTQLFVHTIFDGADPQKQTDIIALGHEMTQGNAGSMSVTINGVPGIVCYQPVPGTSWSLALVSPDSDVLSGYKRQANIVLLLLAAGLLIIILLSQRVVAHAIRPLNQLLEKTQEIAADNTEVFIPSSKREDVLGKLQNSFATMLQSMYFHMGSVRYTTEQTQRRNDELAEATRMAEDSDRQKTAFIQNVSHQIRTPLNIIMGFAQILRDSDKEMSDDERKKVTNILRYNTQLLNRLVVMLFDSSDAGVNEEKNSSKDEKVVCNELVEETISLLVKYYQNFDIVFETDVDDEFYILSNRLYLQRSLQEILYNAMKYGDGKRVMVRINHDEKNIRFIVEDHGKGIAEADRENIFKLFAKVDDLSEGLGLGLPLSKRHAQNLGGDLTLDETYQEGCRFVLEIPVKK